MLKIFRKEATSRPAAIDDGPRSLRPRPPRDDIECSATLCAANAFHRVHLCDVSKHGCKIFIDEPRYAGERVQIALQAYHSLGGTIRWYRDGKAGLQFARQLTEMELVTWKNAVRQARSRAVEAKRPRRNFWGEPVGGSKS
jgi:hypothetical protein